MFKDMKLGARLTIGFGLILVLMGVLVTFAVARVGGLSDRIDVVVGDRLVRTTECNTLLGYLNENARVLRNMVLIERDPVAFAREKERQEAISAAVTDLLDSLNSSIRSEEGKRLLSKVEDARAPYRDAMVRVISLAETDSTTEATAVLFGEMRTAQADYMNAVEEIVGFQRNLATTDGSEAALAAKSTAQILIGLAIAALLLGLGAAWLITSSITTPVRRCIDIANRVARGDTDVAIEGNSTDEMGQLQGALRGMVEAIRRMGKDASQLAKAAVEGQIGRASCWERV